MKKTEIMQARMRLYRDIRAFFAARGVAEVETPMLSPYGSTDVHIDSFSTKWGLGEGVQSLYLHTSPEFAMKCLLADGFGDCFQLGKVFRNEASGRNHRPEFTLLEWYRIGFDLTALMAEVAELAQAILAPSAHLPVEYLSYAEAFAPLGINPHTDDLTTLKKRTKALSGYLPHLDDDRDQWLDFLLVTQIEPRLGKNKEKNKEKDKLTFLTHYPASMSALARTTRDADGNAVAERFELYYRGIELANGFDELTDADEQLARFTADNAVRKTLGKPEIPHDRDLIADLRRGVPHCSGVAIGVDRLLMLALGETSLDAVTVFSAPIGSRD